jgi:formylglycine-generating enzyme required for sulfatase activity
VNVSWEDAQAFCLWLTVHERRANRLGTNYVFRLPTDHEWSCAAGIGEREDPAKSPADKSEKISDAYPWGAQWPPPPNAGNYAGEELQPLLAAGKYRWIKGVISGYRDGFAETSPVGSFAPNRFGLYDLGGNVWQWCEDWFDKEHNGRVLRGGAWDNDERNYLLSSNRLHNKPTLRADSGGFRCVLAPAAAVNAAGAQ